MKILIIILLITGLSADTFPIDKQYLKMKRGKIELTGWYNQRRVNRKHRAIDIPANPGTPVRAFRKGKIIEKGFQYNMGNGKQAYGNYVVIEEENGNTRLYAHLQEYNVLDGQEIKEGQVIGKVGWTGLDRPVAHLHMELRNNNNKKIYFTKSLGDSARKYLARSKRKYVFTLRR